MKHILLFIFFSISLFQPSVANRVLGGDLLYRCLGNSQYEITLAVYRDCNGDTLYQNPVKAISGSDTILITNQTKISQRDVTGIGENCPDQSSCSGGTYPHGVEEHIWKMTLDLSNRNPNLCEWNLSWEQCCRSSSISTGQSNQNYYTTAMLNRCLSPCNSSPMFTNPPVAIICVNQDFVFNNGASDTLDSGDSLSYALVAGLQSAGSQVSYSGQFSPSRPLSFFGFPNQNLSWPAGFRLDPLTGDLIFRPTSVNQVGVIVIEVTEWRRVNGVMEVIGKTRREMAVRVVNCPSNKIPRILPPYSRQACAGQQVCLSISTIDDDTNDTVRISWNRGITGATFTNNNGSVKHASGQVCWTPEDKHISNTPYFFTISAEDDHCPFSGKANRTFSIFVREMPKATRNIQVLQCGKVALSFTPLKTYSWLSSTWEIRDSRNQIVWSKQTTADTINLNPGFYRSYLTIRTSTPCIEVYSDSFYIADYVQIKTTEDTSACLNESIILSSQTSFGMPPYDYQWYQLDSAGPVAISNAESLSLKVRNKQQYVLKINDAMGCDHWDTTEVRPLPLPSVNLGPDPLICEGAEILVANQGIQDTLRHLFRYQWSNGDAVHFTTLREANSYWLRVTDPIGCTNSDTIQLSFLKVKPDAGPDQKICAGDTVTIQADSADRFAWYDLNGFSISPPVSPVSSNSTLQYAVTETKSWIVMGYQTSGNTTCYGFDTIHVQKKELPNIRFNAIPPICHSNDSLNLNDFLSADTRLGGRWTSNDIKYAIAANGYLHLNIIIPNSNPGWHLAYNLTDSNGCSNQANNVLKINESPIVEVADSALFPGVNLIISLNQLVLQPKHFMDNGISRWYALNEKDDVNANIYQSGNQDFILLTNQLTLDSAYYLVYQFEANNGCLSSDTTYIKLVNQLETSINSLEQSSFQLYPNPTSGLLNIRFFNQAYLEQEIQVGIYSAEGKLLLKNQVKVNEQHQASIHAQNLPNGVYILRVIANNQQWMQKFIISK